jgi:hypothetical protein
LGTRALAIALVVALAAGCGGHKAASPESVVRAWSTAIDRGDDEAAANLFAPGAVVIQGYQVVLRTHADAVEWNAGLPCAGHITSLTVDGDEVTAVFRLGQRPGHVCDGPGQEATAIFKVDKGKIILWHQVPNANPNAAPPA